MRILLLGEYSNVHWTLAEGLRALGHDVTVASNGDFWKNYHRDIDLARDLSRKGTARFLLRLLRLLPRMKGYDIVQLINPMFLELKAERLWPVYQWLRNHNRKMVLGAFGMDYYWVHENVNRKPLRYSDFNFGNQVRQDVEARRYISEWEGTAKGKLNQRIARDCDAIVAGLYEYWATYQPVFPDKTCFIPFPIRPSLRPEELPPRPEGEPLRLFLGINGKRSAYKGTDIMLRAAKAVQAEMPRRVRLTVVESLPFKEYRRRMLEHDAILDQLYSYTPSMNPLEAMSHGIICIGGGEPENYAILNEETLRPIINVEPDEESCRQAIRQLALHPERIDPLRRDSIAYICKHHDYKKVARKYEALYRRLLNPEETK
jgi:glycosyltransferase involved in cell wall biosynthesis